MKNLKLFLALNAAILLIASPLLLVSEARAEKNPIQGLSRQPSEAAAQVFLDPNDTVLLLLDHQTGLFQKANLEPSGRCEVGRALQRTGAELPRRERELPAGAEFY